MMYICSAPECDYRSKKYKPLRSVQIDVIVWSEFSLFRSGLYDVIPSYYTIVQAHIVGNIKYDEIPWDHLAPVLFQPLVISTARDLSSSVTIKKRYFSSPYVSKNWPKPRLFELDNAQHAIWCRVRSQSSKLRTTFLLSYNLRSDSVALQRILRIWSSGWWRYINENSIPPLFRDFSTRG